eukprot:m.37109 g.37109  ORF g.37109 m.37109 type:complete len:366 (-) comp17572_c0_seq1:24-1121(-)
MRWCCFLVILVTIDNIGSYNAEFSGLALPRDHIHKELLFIHYHKTGHDVVHELIQQLNRHIGTYFSGGNIGPKRQHDEHGCPSSFTTWVDPESQEFWKIAPDQIQAAPSLFCDDLLSLWPPNVAIVHFIRDPHDMVLSGYLFHSQQPSPEIWATRGDLHPCAYDSDELKRMSAHVSVPWSQIENVVNLCETLFNRSQASTFHQALLTLSPEDGLRLEACRALIMASNRTSKRTGGDVLRMAANSLRLRSLGDRLFTTRTSEWLGSPSIPTRAIVNFAFQNSSVPVSRFEKHISAVCDGMENSFSRLKNPSKDTRSKFPIVKKSSHMTHKLLSNEQRASMQRLLKADSTLGPVLERVALSLPPQTP